MYSRDIKGNVAKACNFNARVSSKSSKFVCKAVRGMELQKAKKFLEEVLQQKKSINGMYYSSISSEILELIKSAEKNAEFKNLDTNNMFIAHIASLKGTTMRRRRHKNKIGTRLKATHIEIILKERSPEGRPVKSEKSTPKAAETKVSEAKTIEKEKTIEAVKEAIKEKVVAQAKTSEKKETQLEENKTAKKVDAPEVKKAHTPAVKKKENAKAVSK